MESIKEFLNISSDEIFSDNFNEDFICPSNKWGCGNACGYGFEWGVGDGIARGYGNGNGDAECNGYGNGDSGGDGTSAGTGGFLGYGTCSDLKIYNNMPVYIVDDIPTLITRVIKNVAKGFIINGDLTLEPCFIVKHQNLFAHSETIQGAREALEQKIFDNLDTDEAIELFLKEFTDINKKYPAKAFYIWHNRLTGSCEMGRKSFIKSNGYDLENDTFTVIEFINITKSAYGGEVIKQLEKKIKQL